MPPASSQKIAPKLLLREWAYSTARSIFPMPPMPQREKNRVFCTFPESGIFLGRRCSSIKPRTFLRPIKSGFRNCESIKHGSLQVRISNNRSVLVFDIKCRRNGSLRDIAGAGLSSRLFFVNPKVEVFSLIMGSTGAKFRGLRGSVTVSWTADNIPKLPAYLLSAKGFISRVETE